MKHQIYGLLIILLLLMIDNSFQQIVVGDNQTTTTTTTNQSITNRTTTEENDKSMINDQLPIINALKNFNNNFKPSLLNQYLSTSNDDKKEDHIFNDIWQRFSNLKTSNNNNNNNNNKNQYEVDYQNQSLMNDLDHDDSSLSAYETTQKHQNHQNELTKLIPTTTSTSTSLNVNDLKNNENKILHRQGHYPPSSSTPYDFQQYLSCCEQLFNKYGHRNYYKEDIFMIPPNDSIDSAERFVTIDGYNNGPQPPIILSEFNNNNNPPSSTTIIKQQRPILPLLTPLYSQTLNSRISDMIYHNHNHNDDNNNNNKIEFIKHHQIPIECIDHYPITNSFNHHLNQQQHFYPQTSSNLISTPNNQPFDTNRSFEPMINSIHRIISTKTIPTNNNDNKLIQSSFDDDHHHHLNRDPVVVDINDSTTKSINNKFVSSSLSLPPPPPEIIPAINSIIQQQQNRLNTWPPPPLQPLPLPLTLSPPPMPIRSIISPNQQQSGYFSKKLSSLFSKKKYFLG